MMLSKIVLLLCILSICIQQVSAQITYSEVSSSYVAEGKIQISKRDIKVNLQNKTIATGHVTLPIFNCGNIDWECKSFSFFTFAKKKSWTDLPDSWYLAPWHYKKEGRREISILGKTEEVELYLIYKKDEPQEHQILMYSRTKGLVGFIVNEYDDQLDREFNTLYMLNGVNGLDLGISLID